MMTYAFVLLLSIWLLYHYDTIPGIDWVPWEPEAKPGHDKSLTSFVEGFRIAMLMMDASLAGERRLKSEWY